MFKKKGIALKTFSFTSALITLVIMISFGILYAILPSYYFYAKNKTLNQNAEKLALEIMGANTLDEAGRMIGEFGRENNTEVMAYTSADEMIVDLSSPFNAFFVGTGDELDYSVKIVLKAALEPEVSESARGTLMLKNVNVYDRASVSGETQPTLIRRQQTQTVMIRKDVQSSFMDYIEIVGTLQPIDEAQRVIISLMPYLLTADVLISFVAAYFFAKRVTEPIVHLSETAASMQTLSPNLRSGIRTNDELGELSENLDSLYSHLCENIESLRMEMTKVSVLERSKADFMRAASHELKTPVAALNGLVEGMIDQVGRYKDRDTYLRESKKLIDNLTGLIREILNASRMDTTEDILQNEPIELWELIETTLDHYRLFIEEKRLDVIVEKKQAIVITDQNVLKNALSNVISNAVHYTADGGRIHIELTEVEGKLVLSVENQCEFVPEADLGKLFEPFYTRSYSRSKSKSGTGLGLHIVRRNLDMLGLPFELTNVEQGLRFSIFFI